MEKNLKRISLMVREDQYTELSEAGINLSGLIRDLIDDYLSEYKITISVTEDTRKIYDLIVSSTGSNDEDLEEYFKEALKSMLSDRIKNMQEIEKKLLKS